MLRPKINRLGELLIRPEDELSRMQVRIRRAARIVAHCYRELVRVRAEGMAAELTFRTIFSLIPVVVLGLVMFRVVGGLEEVQKTVENQLYSFFGVPEIPESYGFYDAPDESESEDAPLIEPEEPIADLGGESHEVQASIRRALSNATENITNLDFASLGIFGLLLFVYAAVALSNAVEYLFNIIFEAPTERPIHLRLAIHWSIITLGSALLAASLYLSGQFIEYFRGAVSATIAVRSLTYALSMLASWVLLFLLYALMPNAKVSVRAAAIGSAVGALLWEIAKLGFQVYVMRAVPYNALYGSLGLIPLFLFWIYVTWLIILFGLVLTHTLQTLRGRPPTKPVPSPVMVPSGDPSWILPVLVTIAEAFMHGKRANQQDIIDRLKLPGLVTQDMLRKLEKAGWVARLATADDDESFTLTCPVESIRVRDVLRLAHQLPEGRRDAAWRPLDSLNEAQLAAAGDKTLADLVRAQDDPCGTSGG